MPAMTARTATLRQTSSERPSLSKRQLRPAVDPLPDQQNFKGQVYAALKSAIAAMDIYGSRSEIRLDERGLAHDFGVSRTPVREAMAQLEREGFVRSVPRRGIYVARKTKRQVIDLIIAWAALEAMAARLVTHTARDDEIAALRRMFATFENGKVRAHLDEYSDINIEFHQALIRMSGNTTLVDLAENLFTHMRMIRRKTIGERDRADRSIRDHMQIIEALEARDAVRAEILVRDHALGLAEHVAKYVDYLD
jgi:DNA-binding GntR family transcriptional regulator